MGWFPVFIVAVVVVSFHRRGEKWFFWLSPEPIGDKYGDYGEKQCDAVDNEDMQLIR